MKSPFECPVSSKAVFRGQQDRGAKDDSKKSSLLVKGLIFHFSFLFVITVIFVSCALDKKGDFYIY